MRLLQSFTTYCKEQNLSSEIDCFHSKSKTIGYLEAQQKNIGVAMLVMMITDLADSFNIGKNMSGAQVIDCAMMIVHEHRDLKIDDVALCFTKIKQQRYGKLFDRLDSGIIFNCIDQFLADKEEQIEYFWKHQQLTIKTEGAKLLLDAPKAADDDTALMHIKAIQKTVTSIQIKNRMTMKRTISTPIKENLMYEIHQVFMQQFAELWEIEVWGLDTPPPRGTKFITRYGKHLDVGEYIEKKHNQLLRYSEKINERWQIYPEPSLAEIAQIMRSPTPEMLRQIKAQNALKQTRI